MSQPLGRAIGNRLELLEAIEILRGQGRSDITNFVSELGKMLLALAGVEKSLEEVRSHLENGLALAKFEEMVVAQGGDLEDLYRPVQVQEVYEVKAPVSGYITELPALYYGLFAMKLGAGRAVKTDPLDFETGLVFEKKVGDRVEAGQILARIYANSEIPKVMLEEFLENVKIGKEEVEIKEIIEIVR